MVQCNQKETSKTESPAKMPMVPSDTNKKEPSRKEGEIASSRELKRKLDAQGKRCFFSGQPLELEDFQIDHLRAVKHGGGHGLENLVFVSSEVNRAKGQMDADDFINLCICVAERWNENEFYEVVMRTLEVDCFG